MKPTILLILSHILFASYCNAEENLTPYIQEQYQLTKHQDYTLSYNKTHEQANWVSYILTSDEVTNYTTDRTDDFRVDPLITTGSANLNDYKGSGYDRGHLAPAADMKRSLEIMSESFYMSNMCPHDPSFNRGIWAKLESLARTWAVENGSIHITTGPIFTEIIDTIGDNQVSVPGHFYKVILDYEEPEYKAIGFVLPNRKGEKDIQAYVVTIDKVEELTGLDFYYALPDEIEITLESTIDIDLWSFKAYSQPNSSTAINKEDNHNNDKSLLYWLTISSQKRHNSSCRYFQNSNGRTCGSDEGVPCGLCGG